MVTEDAEVLDATSGGEGVAETPTVTDEKKVEVDPARAALVNRWLKDVKDAKEHWADAFKRMDVCMKLAANGTTNDSDAKAENGNYVVPILNRLMNQAVASLYAKNPKAVAKRKQKLLYKLWDGDPASIAAAMQKLAPAPAAPAMGHNDGPPMEGASVEQAPVEPIEPDPAAIALLMEIQEVKAQLVQYDRMAKTMGLLFQYYLEEQDCGYKEQFKALVRRTKVCGVSYVDLDFQRILKKNPDVAAQIADTTSMMATIEAQLTQLQAGEIEEGTAKMEELRLLLEDLQTKVDIIAREGPVLSFPRAKEIIPDKKCRHLKTFSGCRWVAREYDLTAEEILEVYGIDVGKNYTSYTKDGKVASDRDKGCCRVYRIQDKRNQQVLTVCDGYSDFLVEPSEPDVKIERFWTTFPLVFNEVESDDEIFPPSDVWNARHMQKEYNAQREGLREHRIAARPGYVAPKGKLEDEDKKKLANKQAFEVVELIGLTPGEDIKAVLQSLPTPGVDPTFYETETVFNDMQRVVGVQEANLGGTSNSTATESSIAENSRATGTGSDVDDLDTMLSALARGMGQLMLTELSKETVIEIAGPGAVWPDMPPTREQVVKDLILEIQAGSSGRPNQAAELAKFERAMPYLTMLPGINPIPLAKKGLDLLDIDIEEAIIEGSPSIIALNQLAGRQAAASGAGPNDPNQQGAEGEQNAPGPAQANEPQSQPAYPAGP